MKNRNTENAAPARRADRQFYRGGWAVLTACMVLAALVLLNVLVGLLPKDWINRDMTATQLYSIGEETKAIVGALEEPVTVYWVASEGYEDATIRELLDRYTELTDKLTVQWIDPTVNPGFVDKYANDGLTQNSLIVESARRYKVLKYDAIYLTDIQYNEDYTDYTTSTTFNGENALTGAIDFVVSETLPVVYYITGHGEPGLATTLASSIADKNITVQELALLSAGAVPEDADAVILDSPSTDLYANEAALLTDYLAGGGKLVLLTNYGQGDMPNLKTVTDAWRLSVQEGLVMEGNTNYYYQYPMYILPDLAADSRITASLATDELYVLYYMAQSIVAAEDKPDDIIVTPLMTTSDLGYIKQDLENAETMEPTDADERGSFDVAVSAQNSATGGQLVWYSSGMLLNNELNSWTAGNNYTLFVNTIGALCEHESAISIPGKGIAAEALLVPNAAITLWKVVYTALLPLCCVAMAVVVFVRRRALR